MVIDLRDIYLLLTIYINGLVVNLNRIAISNCLVEAITTYLGS